MPPRFRFSLLPSALLAVVPLASGVDLQSLESARSRLFPDATLVPADFKLTPEQYARLKSEYAVPMLRPAVKAWRTDAGDWLFLDQVYGRDDIVTYLVAVDRGGHVRGIEVLVCAEGYCNEIYTPEWRARLASLIHGRWNPRDAVPLVSGATLSSVHVAEGVKKILAIHARYLPAAVPRS